MCNQPCISTVLAKCKQISLYVGIRGRFFFGDLFAMARNKVAIVLLKDLGCDSDIQGNLLTLHFWYLYQALACQKRSKTPFSNLVSHACFSSLVSRPLYLDPCFSFEGEDPPRFFLYLKRDTRLKNGQSIILLRCRGFLRVKIHLGFPCFSTFQRSHRKKKKPRKGLKC